MKNQIKRYSEGWSLKYTICTTLYLLHENISKIGLFLEIKEMHGDDENEYFKILQYLDVLKGNLWNIQYAQLYIFYTKT